MAVSVSDQCADFLRSLDVDESGSADDIMIVEAGHACGRVLLANVASGRRWLDEQRLSHSPIPAPCTVRPSPALP